MSRGLTENEATNIVVQGFLEVFTKELPMEYAIEFNRLVKLEMEGVARMTGPAAEVPEASAAGRPRPARRGPADLPFDFADRALARALASEREEPSWLREDRLAAFGAYDEPARRGEPPLHACTWTCAPPTCSGARPYVRTASDLR